VTGPSHPGRHNDITDVAGMSVGHHHRLGRGWHTGTTVVVPPPGTVGGVDVRGGAPGTCETDTLNPINLVDRVDAVCLSGGSAYGLAAATGVVEWLEERRVGFPVGPEPHHVVPIVPAAVLFDVGVGGRFGNRPDASFGRRAAAAARRRKVRQGTVGAGAGSHAERLKGGIGSASVVLPNGITVAALVALNSSGNVFDRRSGELLGLRAGLGDEFAGVGPPSRREVRAHWADPPVIHPLNTTLAVVATDARLAKHECTRMAGSGHDGMARAIDPIHSYVDGDVVFALATGERAVPNEAVWGAIRPSATRPAQLNAVFAAAADVVCRAIVHAALAATSTPTLTCYLDRFPSARRTRS
jgi:L-aminopeptidase/D-esterase-like protein